MLRRSCVFIISLTAMLVLSENFISHNGVVLASSSSLAAPPDSPTVDLALNKPAAQSSTDVVNGIVTSANLAVDGNTNGNIAGGSIAQTLPEPHAWWEVDLGEISYIDTIQVSFRTDCCVNEIKQYYVFVSEVPFISHDFDRTLTQTEVTTVGPIANNAVDLQRTARYVRIQLRNAFDANLSLAEVQVMGTRISNNPKDTGQWSTIPPLHNSVDQASIGHTWNTLSLVHLSLLPSKKLLFWGRDKLETSTGEQGFFDDSENASDAYLWDMSMQDNPNTLQDERLTLVRNNTTNLFCAGHSFLPNGNLFVAGGDSIPVDNTGTPRFDVDGHGVKQTNIFDWKQEKWLAGPNMLHPRWYPSVVTLSTGETLIISGSFVTFNPSNTAVGNQNQDTEILGLDGTLQEKETLPLQFPDYLPNYPFAHLGPDGNVLVVSGTSGKGFFYFPSTGSWLYQPNLNLTEFHDQGTSVMYDSGKIMAIGGRPGTTRVTRDTETMDLNPSNPPDPNWTPHWDFGKSMNFARYYATPVLMPDGEIFIVGGSKCGGGNNIRSPQDYTCMSGAAMYPEIYDPVSQNWSIMSRQQAVRMYHSVALLLPDARILVAGGGRPGAIGETPSGSDQIFTEDKYFAHHEVELFSPPYLFNADGTPATRPTIVSNPSSSSPLGITYGQSFNVAIGNLPATQIQQVVLVRLPSVTHTLNFDQRRVLLAHQVLDQQTLSVTAPPNGIEAPPGPYMLFVIGPNGVPSIAEMMLLANGACSSPPPPTGLVATAISNAQVNITWAAPSTPVHHYELDRKQSISAPFVKIADVANSTTSYTDLSVTGSVTYLYRVRAVCSSGSSSQPSNRDLATTVGFTDDPLTVGVTVVKAQHLNELRAAVNVVRNTAGLSQTGWTDPSLQGLSVKAVHITELRQNLNQALQAMGLPFPLYTDSTLSPGFIVKKVHVGEVRQALK